MIFRTKPDKEDGDESEYYRHRVKCTNCGFSELVYITKGQIIEEQTCPNCDCETIESD